GADVGDLALVAFPGTAGKSHADSLAEPHSGHVRLVDVSEDPHGGEVRDDKEAHGSVRLAIGHDLAGGDIALDDDPSARSRHRDGGGGVRASRDVLELLRFHAEGSVGGGRTLSLSYSLYVGCSSLV